jgi:chemotaxis protein histidine kinase CheA
VHTLKGAARVFGFCEIQDIAHRIEDIFEEVAGKRAVFSSFIAESMFKGLDGIRRILEKIVQGKETDVNVSNLCRELEKCLSGTHGIRTQEQREGRPEREEEDVETQEKGVRTEVKQEGAHEREAKAVADTQEKGERKGKSE